METIAHLWNVNQFITGLKCPLATELQTFYMQKCKSLKDKVELPKQNFGSAVMCSHCGSLWNTVDHQVRLSRGRKMSKSVKRIVRCMNEDARKIPKVRVTLAQKSIKNEMNKLVIKCSVCSKKTELPFKKKSRLKPIKLNDSQIETPRNKRKKKKKKSRDKSAGLNIPGCKSELSIDKKHDNRTPIKSSIITPKITSNKKLTTSTKKSKRLNIERLKHIVNHSTTTPTKKKGLQSFLAELY